MVSISQMAAITILMGTSYGIELVGHHLCKMKKGGKMGVIIFLYINLILKCSFREMEIMPFVREALLTATLMAGKTEKDDMQI